MDLLSPTIWIGFSSALIYYFIMAVTPGPNNIILANSGLNFGYGKTIKLIIGIAFGVNVFLLVAIFGFSHLFNKYKIIHVGISVCGVMFLVYLGFKMAISKSPIKDDDNNDNNNNTSPKRKPLSIVAMSLLQFSNIKSIITAISIVSIYHKPTMLGTYVFLSVVTILSIVVAGNVWILFGSILSKFLKNPKNAQIFNVIMGGTLMGYSLFLLPFADLKAMFL